MEEGIVFGMGIRDVGDGEVWREGYIRLIFDVQLYFWKEKQTETH